VTETKARRELATEQPPIGVTWIRLSRLAALVAVGWAIALQVIFTVLIPPVLVIGMVFLVLAATLRPGRRKLAMAASGFAVLAVVGNLPGVLDDLSHPSSAVVFMLTLVASSAMAVIAIAGLAVWRKWPAPRMRMIAFPWVAVLVIGVGLALFASGRVGSVDAQPGDVEVTTKSLQFDPGGASVPAGRVGIWVDNQDGVRHTFTIPGVGEIALAAFKAGRAEFDLPAGVYQVICVVPGHENMVFELRVGG
jgi:plastocyanin